MQDRVQFSYLLNTAEDSDMLTYAELSGYTPWGKPRFMTHHNGTETEYVYDAKSMRLSQIETTGPGGVVQRKAYQYHPAGDVMTITDKDNVTYTYQYDGLHRLVSETNDGGYDPVSYTYYTYNAIGNIMTKTISGDTFTFT